MEEHSPFAKSVSVSTIFINTSISTTITRYLLPGGRVHPSSAYFCTPTNGKTLLGFRGTFPRAGKACSVPEEHFPKRGNLARFPRDIFPSGETLLAFRGTFSRAGKPCPAPGEHFLKRGNLAALRGRLSTIICSPPSFPIRPHQGVCDTPLQLAAKNSREMMPSITVSHRTNGK